MDPRHAAWLESVVDSAAAVGYAALGLGSSFPGAAAIAAAALVAGMLGLSRVEPGLPTFALPAFNPTALPAAAADDELILSESDRLDRHEVADELVLDDVLAELENFSRVVRLFDRSAMPTPGELQSRIDRHLDGSSAAAPPEDASQALREALSQLRRSLR